MSTSANNRPVAAWVTGSMGCPYAGFASSRYTLQKSSQTSLYVAISASLSRNSANRTSDSATASCNRLSIHATAVRAASGCDNPASTCHPAVNRYAFPILFAKFRPCSHSFSSNGKSFPAGEVSSMPTRTPSAPYCSMRAMGSGLLPRDLDIFRPCLSRTMPV